jgi:hypothetical protein
MMRSLGLNRLRRIFLGILLTILALLAVVAGIVLVVAAGYQEDYGTGKVPDQPVGTIWLGSAVAMVLLSAYGLIGRPFAEHALALAGAFAVGFIVAGGLLG